MTNGKVIGVDLTRLATLGVIEECLFRIWPLFRSGVGSLPRVANDYDGSGGMHQAADVVIIVRRQILGLIDKDDARKLESSGFRFPLACSGNLDVAQDTRFAAGAGRNRREFVMKTSENRSEQDAKITGMSRQTSPVVGRRRAPELTEDVLSEPLMDVQEVVAFLRVSKSMVYKLAE